MARGRKRTPSTAAELAAELASDPESERRARENDLRRAAASEAFRRAAEPLLSALRAAGLPTEGFGTFVSARGAEHFGRPAFDHRRSVPLLLEWLPGIDDARVKEAIVRHLSTQHAKPDAARPLCEEFRQTSSESPALKWAIGNALDVVADGSVFRDLLDLVRDTSHGRARQMIVSRLGRAPASPEIVETLLGLLEDEDVALHAMGALRRQLGPAGVRPHLARLLEHSSVQIRKQAAAEVRKIDQTLARKAPG